MRACSVINIDLAALQNSSSKGSEPPESDINYWYGKRDGLIIAKVMAKEESRGFLSRLSLTLEEEIKRTEDQIQRMKS